VATSNKALAVDDFERQAIVTKNDLPQVSKLGIIGGGELNGRLATLKAIDEIILDIEPIILKEGIPLFGRYSVPMTLQLLGSKLIGDATLQRHYKVV
jgi:dihydrofolate reductase